jgi:hypothetical protein
VAPNSGLTLILTLICAGARRIVLFGFDGANPDPELATQPSQIETYADPDVFASGTRDTQIARDTWVINELGGALVARARAYSGNETVEVLNASPASHITIFPKIALSSAVELE